MFELLRAVPGVCRYVSPDAPERVSRRAFDRARADAGFPNLPTAAQVLRRCASSKWAELLTVLLDPTRDLDKTLAQRTGRRHERAFGDAQVALALRDAARLCGRRNLSAGQYEEARSQMLAAARRRHGRMATKVPTVAQVNVAAGSWALACRLAGLRSGPSHAARAGLSIVDALDLAVQTLGVLPSQKQLERFMQVNGLALSRRTRPWADEVEELRRRRAAHGQPTPGRLPRGARSPDLDTPRLGLSGPPAQRKRATRAECEAAVAAWLAELPSGERPTQRSYARWHARHRERPAASVLGRHGGLRELRAAVGAAQRVGSVA